MIGPAAAFAPAYARARVQFLEAAATAGTALGSHPLPGTGADGETLAIDTARDGAADAGALLILSSGRHGTDGRVGSGVQVFALHDAAWREQAHTAGVAVLYVHALDPEACSFQRPPRPAPAETAAGGSLTGRWLQILQAHGRHARRVLWLDLCTSDTPDPGINVLQALLEQACPQASVRCRALPCGPVPAHSIWTDADCAPLIVHARQALFAGVAELVAPSDNALAADV